jgi:transposase-like protein
MLQTDLYSFSYKKGSVSPFCKRCGAEKFCRDGKSKKGQQIRRCEKCRYRFIWTSDLPRRKFFSNVMNFATEMYARTGLSLRTAAEELKKYFDIVISHEAIRKWILVAKNVIFSRENDRSSTWHVDETYIKIEGRGYWLWIVYARETKQVLAWNITKGRFFKDAKHLFEQALKNAGRKPERLISDGLWQYQAAAKKVFHWKHHERKQRHIVDSGIGKNAFIERLNREVKRRVKWFSTFQSLEGATAFFGLWFYHHNTTKLT